METFNFIQIVLLGVSSGVISLTVSKSGFFEGVRSWVETRSNFLGELINCPYCLGHWVSLILLSISHTWILLQGHSSPLDYIVTWLVTVFVSTVSAGTMLKLLS